MARYARLVLVPLTLAAAAPAVAQAAAGVGQSAAGIVGAFGNLKLYPLGGSHIDPLSNVVGTSLGGIPVSTQPVSDAVADGLPVRDLPLVGGLMNQAPAAPAAQAASSVTQGN
ncbi:MAG TPA: hypothetical protein VH372_01450 [Actinospica sp.]|jgi:hypothetical protein|nr:hypothetical protein [Actinospica sp.]